ncbi:MAG: hypothetical protein AAF950_17390 [Pseudomonadota bacterium]
MDQDARLVIFQAQVKNVRSLKSALRQIRRSINASLRGKDQPAVDTLTKTYALLFCAWAEANFSKVVHTPYGFDLDEIGQVQAAKAAGIVAAWKKCVELGLRHLNAERGSFQPNARRKLERAIDDHVLDPSELRNKLAHGQWVIALNRNNDAIQKEMSLRIERLDLVKIDSWIAGHDVLAQLVEQLIESPQRAFVRDWYRYVVDLEQKILAAKARTLRDHVIKLLRKPAQRVG